MKRKGMVCYWRLSIDLYIKERYKHEKYLLFAQEKINNIEKDRHHFGNRNINVQKDVNNYEYLNIKKGKCNLSVESFIQPFVSMMSDYLGHKKNASMEEIITILGIIGYKMPSCVYSMITIRIIIAYDLHISEWLLYMKKVASQIRKTGNVPLLRFAKYRRFEDDFTEKDKINWNEGVHNIVKEVLRISSLREVKFEE